MSTRYKPRTPMEDAWDDAMGDARDLAEKGSVESILRTIRNHVAGYEMEDVQVTLIHRAAAMTRLAEDSHSLPKREASAKATRTLLIELAALLRAIDSEMSGGA